jgi:hypothetical protein
MPSVVLSDTSLLVVNDRVLVYGTELESRASGVVSEGSISR